MIKFWSLKNEPSLPPGGTGGENTPLFLCFETTYFGSHLKRSFFARKKAGGTGAKKETSTNPPINRSALPREKSNLE